MEGDSKTLNLNLWSLRRHIADVFCSFFNRLSAINHSIAWWSTNGASKFDQSQTASTELRHVFPLVFTMLSFVCVFHVCVVVYLQFSFFGVCLRTVWWSSRCKSSFSLFRRWNMLLVTFVHFDKKKKRCREKSLLRRVDCSHVTASCQRRLFTESIAIFMSLYLTVCSSGPQSISCIFLLTVNTKLPAIFIAQRWQRNWNMNVIILVLELQNISAGKENVS